MELKAYKTILWLSLTMLAGAFDASSVAQENRGVALVFSGQGVCPEGCADAGAAAATLAGLIPKFVLGNELNSNSTVDEVAAFFADAKVWIMPGGFARNELSSMTARLKTELKNFIQGGGGYVGWCAGAFAATSIVGTTGSLGLGLIEGRSAGFSPRGRRNSYGGSIEKSTWFNETRYFYFEGGARFYQLPSDVEVVGRFDDQVSISAVRSTYGSGRVFLTGMHPEAPVWWWNGTGINDPDGSDLLIATEMVKWTSRLSD